MIQAPTSELRYALLNTTFAIYSRLFKLELTGFKNSDALLVAGCRLQSSHRKQSAVAGILKKLRRSSISATVSCSGGSSALYS